MSTIHGSLNISLTFDETSLVAHKRWMEYLISSEAAKDYGRYFDAEGLAERLEGKAKAVVQRYVYDAHTPQEDDTEGGKGYRRSMNLLNSITAVKDSIRKRDVTGYAVYSDWQKPGVETKWSPKGSAEAKLDDSISYAAYFLRGNKSFIKPSGMPKRDFWTPMVAIIMSIVQKNSRKALETLLRTSRPEKPV